MATSTLTVQVGDIEPVRAALAEAGRLLTQARRIAVALEQECADKDRRIASAIRWLELAESYSPTEDCSSAIDDAMAALRGGL